MKLSEKMKEKQLLSFELFPPKTEKGMANLPGTIEHLMEFKPEYISCTYGAGGGNVGANREVCQMIKKAGSIPVTHFTVIKNTKEGIREQLDQYLEEGVDHMLALRGDFPMGETSTMGDFDYATDLVKFVRDQYGDKFEIAVAGSPEGHISCRSLEADIAVLKQKQDNGADYIMTQLCWDMEQFKYWLDAIRKAGVTMPVRIHILPDGCTDFIFTLGEVADTVEEESLIMQPYRSYFVGPMTKYSELITYSESVHMFGVRFLPCGLSCFTKLPLHEFVNDRISTREMKAVFDDTFVERLCEQEHIGDRIRIVEEYLLSYLSRHYESADSHIVVAVDIINQFGGKRPVRSLIDEVCLCQRHFERKFKYYTGFTPKEYSRIVKFKNAVELLRNTTSPNLLTTAVNAGYYDLAHFSKEIKTLSGNTPASFLSITIPDDTTLTYIEPQK